MYFGMITVVTDVGFNRYIVECKFDKIFYILKIIIRFNRYIVECKFIIVTWIILSRLDLIDT